MDVSFRLLKFILLEHIHKESAEEFINRNVYTQSFGTDIISSKIYHREPYFIRQKRNCKNSRPANRMNVLPRPTKKKNT